MNAGRELDLLVEIQQRLSVYLGPGPKGPQLIREALNKAVQLRGLLAARRKTEGPAFESAYDTVSEMAERLSGGMLENSKECAERAIKTLRSGGGGSSGCP